jgi:hypothetical protein
MTNFEKRMNEINKILNEQNLTKVAHDHFKKITPRKTGNAQQSTTHNQNSIVADYPYAFVLDAGRGHRDGQMRGSTQAPKGMSQPTVDYIRDYIKKTLR